MWIRRTSSTEQFGFASGVGHSVDGEHDASVRFRAPDREVDELGADDDSVVAVVHEGVGVDSVSGLAAVDGSQDGAVAVDAAGAAWSGARPGSGGQEEPDVAGQVDRRGGELAAEQFEHVVAAEAVTSVAVSVRVETIEMIGDGASVRVGCGGRVVASDEPFPQRTAGDLCIQAVSRADTAGECRPGEV